MSKELVIAASRHETKVTILEDGEVVEVSVEREQESGLVGSIYKGRVSRVLPGMQSAFVNIGLDRDAFLYVSDFFEDREEYERIPTSAEEGSPAAPEPRAAAASEPARQTEPEPALSPAAPVAEAAPAPAAARTELPEPRPLGRRSHHARHRGRRGGPGRSPGRFQSRPYAPPSQTEPETSEPVILPGESLAKYRDRPPQPATEAPSAEPARRATLPVDVSAEARHPEVSSPSPVEEAAAAERRSGHELASTPKSSEPKLTLPSTSPPEHEAHREAARRKQESDYISIAEVDSSEPAPASPPEPPEPYPEVPEDLGRRELRVEEDNSAVALPPSVRERTAGGVEWERPGRPGRQRRRGGRLGQARRRPGAAPGPRAKIAELLQAGQEIIVQIAKEQLGKKGARITSHVTLPGRYMVYMPTIDHIGVSRRIGTVQERARLRRLLLELKGSLTGGMVVRTAAEGASEEEIRRDLDYLVNTWRAIVQRGDETQAPTLLHRDLSLMERILRDQLTADFETIWVENEEDYSKVVELVSRFQPVLVSRVKLYTKEEPIFEGLGIQAELDRALKPKVWLKSGGYIVINHTEALVAIDVNTGKFVGKGSTRLEDTIVRTNLEAVREIVRQIRLRDLGGIIIIDFIDMEDRRNRQKVMQELERALRNDRSPSKTLAFNEFGLIAITRKRVRQSLEKVLCQPCPYCTGTGMLKSVPTLCFEIQAEAKKMARTIDAPELTIRAHPEVAKALKAREAGLLRELEEQTGKTIIVQPDQSLPFDQYTIF